MRYIRSERFLGFTFVLVVFFAPNLVRAQNATPGEDSRRAERITPVVKVFQAASPAVVNLSTTTIVSVRSPFGINSMFEDIFDLPLGRRQYESHSVGSGFVIHGDGYIVTNAHVIDQAAECKVTFADGVELPAQEVARDNKNDLAVLKVDAPKPLPYLPMGRSSDLMPGETIIAIGNPLGYQHTVTTGIISAVNRELRFSRNVAYTGLIQIDAPINPGNSGGPLLNALGELIGINSAIRGDAQNIGFAIPVDRLHDLLPTMLDISRLRRLDFGVQFNPDTANGGPGGVRVGTVEKDSPAAKAGLRPGDIVTAIDRAPTQSFMDAFSILNRSPTGKTLHFDVIHDGGKKGGIDILLAAIPRLDSTKLLDTRFGLSVRALNAQDLKRLGLRRAVGLMIVSVKSGGPAAEAGITAGDIVTLFGGWPVTSLSALEQLIEQVSPDDRIPFQLLRIRGEGWTRFEVALRAR